MYSNTYINGEQIENISTFKYLGVMLNDKLSVKYHTLTKLQTNWSRYKKNMYLRKRQKLKCVLSSREIISDAILLTQFFLSISTRKNQTVYNTHCFVSIFAAYCNGSTRNVIVIKFYKEKDVTSK